MKASLKVWMQKEKEMKSPNPKNVTGAVRNKEKYWKWLQNFMILAPIQSKGNQQSSHI